jgi:hypothetical protein
MSESNNDFNATSMWGDKPEKLEEALQLASFDPEYRAQLLRDPSSALRDKGVVIPDGVKLTVHEFSMEDRHIFLPPLWAAADAAPLSAPPPPQARAKAPDAHRGRPPAYEKLEPLKARAETSDIAHFCNPRIGGG